MRGIESLVFEQGFGEYLHGLAAFFEKHAGAFIGFIDDALHLGVDLLRGVLAVFARARNVAGQKHMLAAFSETNHSERAHAPFANHLAGEAGSLTDIA